MPKEKGNSIIGAWAFLIGIILAVFFAVIAMFTSIGAWLGWILFLLGIVIGLLNISDKEVQPFLMAGAILVIVSSFGSSVFATIVFVPELLNNILSLFVPATIIVAIKTVFSMAKN